MNEIILKQNGDICIFGMRVGRWERQDIWKENGGKYDRSGNRLVECFYHAWFINGKASLHNYTRRELKAYVMDNFKELVKYYHSMSDKAAEIAIRHAKDDNKAAKFYNGSCHA